MKRLNEKQGFASIFLLAVEAATNVPGVHLHLAPEEGKNVPPHLLRLR